MTTKGAELIEPTEQIYRELLARVKDRTDQVAAFDKFLCEKTNWLTAPASTKFHLAEKGGLLKHSVNVAETLLKLRETLMPSLSVDTCIIAAIFHDAGKVGYDGVPYYIPNPEEWQVQKRGKKFIVNPDCIQMDIASRSLYLVARYINLTTEEAQAIRYHDGQYIEENKSVAHKEVPLTRLIQYADNWSGGVLEETICLK